MKKFFKICSAVLVAVAMAGIGYWNASSQNADVNLSELVEVADADAECYTSGLLTGKCIIMMQVCSYSDMGLPSHPCDPCYMPRN